MDDRKTPGSEPPDLFARAVDVLHFARADTLPYHIGARTSALASRARSGAYDKAHANVQGVSLVSRLRGELYPGMSVGKRGALFDFLKGDRPMVTTVSEIERLLSPSQAARRACVSDQTVKYWIRTGRLPALRTAIGHLVNPDDLDAYARERAMRSAPC